MTQEIHAKSNQAINRHMSKFTASDLLVMKNALNDVLTQMQEDLATSAEKSSVIIPLFKIEHLISKL
jgi:hypothetical protein